MIGILFLTGMGLWIAAAVMLSERIPRWLGINKHQTIVSVLLFPLVLVLPIADDLIGRWQFYQLCDKEAVVTLSPDWERVKRARWQPSIQRELDGYAIPIRSWKGDILDIDTGKVFITIQAFFTSGGFFQRHLYGLGGSTDCQPKNLQAVQSQINLLKLLKQGETK